MANPYGLGRGTGEGKGGEVTLALRQQPQPAAAPRGGGAGTGRQSTIRSRRRSGGPDRRRLPVLGAAKRRSLPLGRRPDRWQPAFRPHRSLAPDSALCRRPGASSRRRANRCRRRGPSGTPWRRIEGAAAELHVFSCNAREDGFAIVRMFAPAACGGREPCAISSELCRRLRGCSRAPWPRSP